MYEINEYLNSQPVLRIFLGVLIAYFLNEFIKWARVKFRNSKQLDEKYIHNWKIRLENYNNLITIIYSKFVFDFSKVFLVGIMIMITNGFEYINSGNEFIINTGIISTILGALYIFYLHRRMRVNISLYNYGIDLIDDKIKNIVSEEK